MYKYISFSKVASIPPHHLIMESPNTKQAAQKLAKNNSQATLQSTTRTVRSRSTSPQQRFKNHSWSRNDLKERQGDQVKVVQKPLLKEYTKPVDFKLHTQQRAVNRAIFDYTVATKLYLMEQQKKQVKKVVRMIEEEEVRMLRKEMVPRAQLMPRFDRPFYPQRSTRPLTVPREPSMMSDNSNRFSFYNLFSFRHNEAH